MTSRLFRSLQARNRAHPTSRKILVCPTVNWGREVLRVLARMEGVWIGWEPMTLRAVAGELAQVPLVAAGRRGASDVALTALVDQAVDTAARRGELRGPLARMAQSGGVRRAIADGILELRTGGVASSELVGRGHGDTVESLAAILGHYHAVLDAQRLADPALVFTEALAGFDTEAPLVLPDTILLAPGLTTRGLAGQLLDRLRSVGAVDLDADGRMDSAPGAFALDDIAATVDCFVGATPSEELREALRRVAAEELRHDEVELVTTDPDTYGVALDALCRATGARATQLRGIPLMRTRIGRALERWMLWLEEGLPADRIRDALEAGDLVPPPGMPDVLVLARELRRLEIGWGRDRWQEACERLAADAWQRDYKRRHRRGDADDLDANSLGADGAAVSVALREFITTLLARTPVVPERTSGAEVRVAIHTLALAAQEWLDWVPSETPDASRTMERLRQQLRQLGEVPADPLPFAAALAGLRQALADLRAWTDTAPSDKPWVSAGGCLHLTDLMHAGSTGRRRVFVVGMDADRVRGGRSQDALLPDGVRRHIGTNRLTTTEETRAERGWLLARSLAGLRGRVTLSWSHAADLTGRRADPAPVVLDALRLGEAKPGLSYKELSQLAGPPACAVPDPASVPLDVRDVWLQALADGPLLLDGTVALRQAWPHLGHGRLTMGARTAAGVVDPTAGQADPISATSLELLSKCPLAWFYQELLQVVPTTDPEYDPDQWLDATQRGSLLHEFYDRAGRQFQDRQHSLGDAGIEPELQALADQVIAEWREKVPVPSEAVYAGERDELHQCARAFLELERQDAAGGGGPHWKAFEQWIDRDAATYRLPDGRRLRLKGRVDRIDALPGGRLRVVDYKTGSSTRFRPTDRMGPLNGGRLLQPALYAAAVSTMSGDAPTEFEYRFPTPRGRNEKVRYDQEQLSQAAPVIAGLLEHLASGTFVPTTDKNDCAYCNFQEICRVEMGRFGRVDASPRAEEAALVAPEETAFAPMLARRGGGEA